MGRDFWEGYFTQEQVDGIEKENRERLMWTRTFWWMGRRKVWCTLDEEQIDINCKSETSKKFIRQFKDVQARRCHDPPDAFCPCNQEDEGTSCFFH